MEKALCRLLTMLSIALLANPIVIAQAPDLEALVDSIAEEHIGSSLVGLSVGVARGDEVLLKKSYGHANLEWQVPMPMDAVHEIGSVTKQFTTVAMLQLYGQERLDLDADISEYLPDFDTQGRQIPVRRLVDHTSGIKGYTEIPEFWSDLAYKPGPRQELLRLIEQQPFDFEPGEALIYNNSAYFLIGLIIEEISGQSYEDYIEQNVFPLANMENSSYCSNSDVVDKNAAGYQRLEDTFIRAQYHDHTWPYSAGSLCSTISDLLAWNHALHNGGVLSPALYSLLITPSPLNDGTPVRYAMGLNHYLHATGRVIEHGGGIPGFLTHSRYYPDDDVSIVVLLNASGFPGPVAITNQIGEHLFGNRGEPKTAIYEGDLASFIGEYRGAGRGAEMTVTVENGDNGLHIVTSVNGLSSDPRPLSYVEDYRFSNGSTYFIFDSPVDGSSRTLRMDNPGSHYVLENVSD